MHHLSSPFNVQFHSNSNSSRLLCSAYPRPFSFQGILLSPPKIVLTLDAIQLKMFLGFYVCNDGILCNYPDSGHYLSPCLVFKTRTSDTGLCLPPKMARTQVAPTETTSLCLRPSGDRDCGVNLSRFHLKTETESSLPSSCFA
jgi:hypothetical protein